MGKTIRLTESDLIKVIKRIISEQNNQGIVVQYYEGKPTINGNKISIKQIVKGDDKINIPQEGKVELKYPNGGVVTLEKGSYKVSDINQPEPFQSSTSVAQSFQKMFTPGRSVGVTAGIRR